MTVVEEGAAERTHRRGHPDPATTLSVCCMTSGRRPGLLAGVLAALRPVADEIVVAVEAPMVREVQTALAGVADRLLAFEPTHPADRPIAWLFRSCAGKWVFNLDDDEVPSPSLVAALPALVRREDITHAWIARRWLHPSAETFIVSPPWGNEFQLRLVLADDRWTQFSDVFHRPVVCHGPSLYVEEPLWHLDTALNPAASRRAKAAAYELERPGIRVGGLAHNLGMYVPELDQDLGLAPVPEGDRRAIAAACAYPSQAPDDRLLPVVEVTTRQTVDSQWVGAPFPESLYQGRLELVQPPSTMSGASQHTIDVRVMNESDVVWRWGRDARPAIGLGYRWWRDGQELSDPAALRTTLPRDLAPGDTQLVPVHIVAPEGAGVMRLEIDLIHQGERWFGCGRSVAIGVRPKPRVALIAAPARVAAALAEQELAPAVEALIILRDPADRDAYGDFRTVVGLRRYLLHQTEGQSRAGTGIRLLARTIALARRREDHWSRPGYAGLLSARASADQLIVDGPNWEADAAFGREWAWVAVTALLWRMRGARVLMREAALPAGRGPRTVAVRTVLRALRTDH